MASGSFVFLLAVALTTGADASSLRSRAHQGSLTGYSFAQYVKDHDRSYVHGSKEYVHRAGVFHASLLEIHAANAKSGRTWTAGHNKFMDYTREELHVRLGYKPNRAHARAGGMVELQTSSSVRLNASELGRSGGLALNDGPAIRDQGDCGSCWAISSVEAVEAQLGNGKQLSAQALVDCVPNPQHCGGKGGCDGATGELAYKFMREHGIPLEDELQYQGQTQSCPMDFSSSSKPRAKVGGWKQIPSNEQAPLMQALVQDGPAVVAVAADTWFNYESGVFDACKKDAVISHAVLAKGYGEDNGSKYWLIQNSWGSGWGEQGQVRLLRHDDESAWCGTDNKPEDGLGCDGGPKEVTICGMCGILYDPLVPTGAFITEDNSA